MLSLVFHSCHLYHPWMAKACTQWFKGPMLLSRCIVLFPCACLWHDLLCACELCSHVAEQLACCSVELERMRSNSCFVLDFSLTQTMQVSAAKDPPLLIPSWGICWLSYFTSILGMCFIFISMSTLAGLQICECGRNLAAVWV